MMLIRFVIQPHRYVTSTTTRTAPTVRISIRRQGEHLATQSSSKTSFRNFSLDNNRELQYSNHRLQYATR